MIWEGKEERPWTDYTLGTDHHLFGNVSVRDPRNYSYRYMLLGYLHSAPLREHTRYIRGHKWLNLRPATAPTREDGKFADLQRAVPKPLARDARKNAWISEGHVETS